LSGYIFQFCNGTWNGTHCLPIPSPAWSTSLSGWRYRKSHNISNANGADVNYTVNITIINGTGSDSGNTFYINNKMKNDFGDVRFTNATGSLLNYWIESVNIGSNATFWVRIDGNLTTTNQTIYIYYGKSDATNISNINNTFIFGDDFSGSSVDTNKWTVTGSPSVSNGILTLSSGQNILGKTNISPNASFRSRVKSDVTGNNNALSIFGFQSSDGNNVVYYYISNGYDNRGRNIKAGGSSLVDMAIMPDTNYHIYETFWNLTLTTFRQDSGSLYSLSSNIPIIAIPSYHFARPTYTTYQYVDWTFIRNYTSPEPSHGIWGSEETSSGWVNDTCTSFSGGTWSNTTKTINSTEGATVAWCVYANDTSNNWNSTSCSNPFSYVTTAADTTKPTYSLNSTNSTTAGTPVLHSLNWTDDVGLSGYIFSFDNCTGSLDNETWASFSGGTWSNFTETVNSTSGCTIRWCFYANDTSNNWNGTSCDTPFTYTTNGTVFISISVSQALLDGITFGTINPNTNDNPAINNTNGVEGGTAYNITIDSSTTVNVDLYNDASGNLVSGSYIIAIGNVTHKSNITSNTGDNLVATDSIALSTTYSIIGNNVCQSLAANSNCWIRYWLDSPTAQPPGNYTTTYKYCAVENGAGYSQCG
jgi:hypothetical protein